MRRTATRYTVSPDAGMGAGFTGYDSAVLSADGIYYIMRNRKLSISTRVPDTMSAMISVENSNSSK